jgi:ADP-ribosylglycohydrolase
MMIDDNEQTAENVLIPGIYGIESSGWDNEGPFLYVVLTEQPRTGNVQAAILGLHNGRIGPVIDVQADALIPIRHITSLPWVYRMMNYLPADQSRRMLPFFSGCLLGGAVGDALGTPVEKLSLSAIHAQFGPGGIQDYAPTSNRVGTITWHTQMTLFTAEGLLRAKVRGDEKGIGGGAPHCVYHAYLRWMDTQGERAIPFGGSTDRDGWLITVPELHQRRSPSRTTLQTLQMGKDGTISPPLNQSKGCGAVARVAPVGLAWDWLGSHPFYLGGQVASHTHGHPTARLAAGCFAMMINTIMDGASLQDAIDTTTRELVQHDDHEECFQAITRARDIAQHAPARAESVECLGSGWTADEALAITLFCALKAESFEHGVTLAVNHGGDSDVTGAMTGQLLGALWGRHAIPGRWLAALELGEVIEELAWDMWAEFSDAPYALWFRGGWAKYPGW